MRKIVTLSVLVFIFSALSVQAQGTPTQRDSAPDPAQYRFEPLVSGFSWPLYLTNAGDGSGRLFLLQQTGQIFIISDGQTLPTPFLDISNLVTQDIRQGYTEQGLLNLAFHPDFAHNGQFFVHYNQPDGTTTIARYHVSADDPNVADPNSGEILFTLSQPYFNHDGGQLAFGPDGFLYIALGDGGSQGDPQNRAQNPQALWGKILRIDVDGDQPYGIPADNPANTNNPNLLPEIWAWGLRNPWRFSFNSVTGDLYIADVGQNQWEEIDFQAAGSPGGVNYGWHVWEGNHRYSLDADPADVVFPVVEYSHSQGCSVSGGYVYHGSALPDLNGVYIYGDYCSGSTWTLYRDSSGKWTTAPFVASNAQISSFGVDEAGELYLVDYHGSVLKLVAAG